MRIPALSRVSDKKEGLHQIFIAILPRGLVLQTSADCYSTGGKTKPQSEFHCKDLQIGPCTKEETAAIITQMYI